jgi:hypothetical protein
MCRRVRLQSPTSPLIVGIWSHGAPLAEIAQRLIVHRPTAVVDLLSNAVNQIEGIVGRRELPVTLAESPITATAATEGPDQGIEPPLAAEPRG